jgi:hypothetical protein
MKILKHFITMLLYISLCMLPAQAQQESDRQHEDHATNTIAQDVLIIIQQEQVRFTARKGVAEMQLQIFDQAGQLVYDSGAVIEPEVKWALRRDSGEAVKSGLYAYTLSLKEADAETARVRRGHFIVDRAKERDGKTDRLWITSQNDSGVGTELTLASSEGAIIAGANATSERKSVNGAEGAEREAEGAGRNGESDSKNKNTEMIAQVANGTTGRIAKFISATDLGESGITELNGNVGIGTPNPISKFHIVSGASDYLPPRLQSSATNTFAAGWDFYHGSTGVGYVGAPDGGAGIAPGEMLVYGVGKTSLWAGGQRSVTIAPNGSVGIGTTNPISRLEIAGQDGLNVVGYQPFLTLTDSNASGARARIQNVNGGINFQTHEQTLYGGSSIFIQDHNYNVGIGVTNPQAKLDVNGSIKAYLLYLTWGSDFAENFDVNVATTSREEMTPKVEAGMVVSLDPANPGKLTLSAQAYDRRVAGIISGAGGIRPGMVMGQEGSLADGKHPVALSGRVYCWVDASRGAIEPGDLLTTSSTIGYAMKAADPVKAQGAIIGKAMTGLKEGKGLVLTLVTLQ